MFRLRRAFLHILRRLFRPKEDTPGSSPEERASSIGHPIAPLSSDMIRLLVKKNPKRPGSKSYDRFSLYMDGMTIAQYIDAVRTQMGDGEAAKCMLDLQWDSDPGRAFIRVERAGRPVGLHRSASMSRGKRATETSVSTRSVQSSAPSRQSVMIGESATPHRVIPPVSLLDGNLVQAYCENFLGYGNFSAPFWFIGEQEGGGEKLQEAQRRLAAWRSLGSPSLADCEHFHREISENRWHGVAARTQATWEPFIRIVLAVMNDEFDRFAKDDDVLRFQKENLGRLRGDNCVIYLLPLATRGISAKHWKWNQWCTNPKFSNPTTFQRWIIPVRISEIAKRLNEIPAVNAIFFGTGKPFLGSWRQICPVRLTQQPNITYQYSDGGTHHVWFGSSEAKNFLVLPHPNARIIGNRSTKMRMWNDAARLLRPHSLG